jgi:hypothetical protein
LGVSALAPKPSATATPIRPMMSFSAFACATPCCRRLLPSVCVALADVSASLCQETVHVREHADDAGVARLLDPAEQDARAAALFVLTAQRVSFRVTTAGGAVPGRCHASRRRHKRLPRGGGGRRRSSEDTNQLWKVGGERVAAEGSVSGRRRRRSRPRRRSSTRVLLATVLAGCVGVMLVVRW